MKKAIDKLMIIAAGIMMSFGEKESLVIVTAFLMAVIICTFSGGKIFSRLKYLYLVPCIFFDPFMCFLPLIFYESVSEKVYTASAASAVLCIGNTLSRFDDTSTMNAVISVLAVILALRTSSLLELEDKFRIMRDSSAELNIHMKEKNERIMLEQDHQIHLAKLMERNRIAREIHDNVGHMLSRSILQTAALQVICTDENIKESLSSLNETLNTAMTDIRRSVHDLHDESIDLREALKAAAAPLREKDIDVTEELNFGNDIPNKVKISFIGIVKEGVSNILRHSNADKVWLTLNDYPAFYQLILRDNGKCGEIMSSGIGLENIKSRVQSLGGILKIDSTEKGFRIFVTVRKEIPDEDNSNR